MHTKTQSHEGDETKQPNRPTARSPLQEIANARWIAPSENNTATTALETRLWDAADQRAGLSARTDRQNHPAGGARTNAPNEFGA